MKNICHQITSKKRCSFFYLRNVCGWNKCTCICSVPNDRAAKFLRNKSILCRVDKVSDTLKKPKNSKRACFVFMVNIFHVNLSKKYLNLCPYQLFLWTQKHTEIASYVQYGLMMCSPNHLASTLKKASCLHECISWHTLWTRLYGTTRHKLERWNNLWPNRTTLQAWLGILSFCRAHLKSVKRSVNTKQRPSFWTKRGIKAAKLIQHWTMPKLAARRLLLIIIKLSRE